MRGARNINHEHPSAVASTTFRTFQYRPDSGKRYPHYDRHPSFGLTSINLGSKPNANLKLKALTPEALRRSSMSHELLHGSQFQRHAIEHESHSHRALLDEEEPPHTLE